VVDELKAVAQRKFPNKAKAIEALLAKMSYEYVYTPDSVDDTAVSIRDKKDYPVLHTAMLEDIDILITGDKDFEDVDIEKPEILTPSEFIEHYC